MIRASTTFFLLTAILMGVSLMAAWGSDLLGRDDVAATFVRAAVALAISWPVWFACTALAIFAIGVYRGMTRRSTTKGGHR